MTLLKALSHRKANLLLFDFVAFLSKSASSSLLKLRQEIHYETSLMNSQTDTHVDTPRRHHDYIPRAWHTDAWTAASTLGCDKAFTGDQTVRGGGPVRWAVIGQQKTRQSVLHDDTSVYE